MRRRHTDVGATLLLFAVLLTNARGSDAARASVIARASRAAYDVLSSAP